MTTTHETSTDLDRVFGALAHPTRRAILRQVSTGRRTVLELAAPHRMSVNAVSKHIKRLEDAGLVAREVEGREHRISLEAEALDEAFRWIVRYSRFWSESLDSLKRSLEDDR